MVKYGSVHSLIKLKKKKFSPSLTRISLTYLGITMSMLLFTTRTISHVGLQNFVGRFYFKNSISQQSNSMR